MSRIKTFEVKEALEKEINDHIKKKGYTLSEFIRESIRKNLGDANEQNRK